MKSMSSHKTESQLFNTYSRWESSLDNNSSHSPFENDWLYIVVYHKLVKNNKGTGGRGRGA